MLALAALVFVVTRVDAGAERKAQARASAATGVAVLSESVNGDAVVRAANLKPGKGATGTVTVENSGDATGAFALAQIDVLDTPGAGGGRLSTAARMRVDDAGSDRVVYRGPLGAMPDRRLGYLRAGQKRTYRFTLSLPARAKAGPLAGSQVETTFDWTAQTAEPPAPDRGPDSTPPVVAVQSPLGRGTATVALTCDEPCRIVGLTGGARLGPRQRVIPGRPTLQAVRLPNEDAGVPLLVTIADRAGNRTVAAVVVAPER